jgi:hypothetical protein
MPQVSELWTYGFVEALLALLQQNSQLISAVEQSCIYGERKTFPDVPLAFTSASNAVAAYQSLTGKNLFFFLDEFSEYWARSTLALFCRNLMDLNACVLVALMDSGAVHMLNANAVSLLSSSTPWMHLCPQSPRFVRTRLQMKV